MIDAEPHNPFIKFRFWMTRKTRLMEMIGESVRERIQKAELTPVEDDIRKCILRTFAKTGNPPKVKEIMETVTVSSKREVTRAIRKLRNADILATQADAIISAYPFSAVKTGHTIVFANGHSVNALCATDAMGVHFMLGKNITIRSRCPECGDEITLVLKDGRIASRNPAGAIEYVKIQNKCGCTAETCCPHINFFCRKGHLEQWKIKNPAFRNGEVYTLEEALEDGKMIFEDFLK